MQENEIREEEQEELQSLTITDDDGTEKELFLVDQTKVNGEDYLLLTDTREDGGTGFIYRVKPDPDDEEELILEAVSDEEYDYLVGVFEQQSDVDFS